MHNVHLKQLGIDLALDGTRHYRDHGEVFSLEEQRLKICTDAKSKYIFNSFMKGFTPFGECITRISPSGVHYVHVSIRGGIGLTEEEKVFIKGHEETHALLRLHSPLPLKRLFKEHNIPYEQSFSDEEHVATLGGICALIRNPRFLN